MGSCLDNGIEAMIPVYFRYQILQTDYNLLVFMVMIGGRGGYLCRGRVLI